MWIPLGLNKPINCAPPFMASTNHNSEHACGVSWPSGLVHRTQALVLSAAECGFEILVMTLVPLSKALNQNCFVKKVVRCAPPSRLRLDDTHAYILTDCEGGNPVSAPGVGGNVPLVTVDLGRQPKSVKCSPHLEVPIRPWDVRQYLTQTFFVKKSNSSRRS